MFQAESLIEQIREAEHGTARMQLMADAIAQADDAAAHYWRIYFRFEYIQESVFYDDNFKAIIMFPTLLQVFDEHPELEDDTYDDVMQAYKWILENMACYYQISREEIERYYEDYKQRCEKYGFSLRVYYMKKSKFYLPIDVEKAKELYHAFRETKHDVNSDCEACEIHHAVTMALEFGEEEEAMRIAEPLLNGTKRCAEVPHITYGILTKHHLYAGNLTEAAYYGRLCERYTQSGPEFLEETGYLLEMYSAIAPAEGWKLFKRNIENFVSCKNPRMRMSFARGAYRLLQSASKEIEYTNSRFLNVLPLTKSEDGYRMEDVAAYFYQIAKEQSQLIDKRNGTDYYQKILEIKLPEASENFFDEEAVKSEHGIVSGMHSGTMTAISASADALTVEEMKERLSALSEQLEVIAAESEETSEGEGLYLAFRFEGKIYEAHLIWFDITQELIGKRCYALDDETFEAMHNAKKQLLMAINYSDDGMLSLHLAMHILYTILPDMLGVIDLMTQKMYPANWVAFAGAFRNAVTPSDLFDLYITGTEESDEIWMTTHGLCTLGLRELEMVGANRENFGYFANLLYFAACNAAESSMLPDAGEPFASLQLDGGIDVSVAWGNTAAAVANMSDTIAQQVDRHFPSGVLYIATEQDGMQLPTQYAPMMQGVQPNYPNPHSDFVRRIYLAKETIPCLKRALTLPLTQAAVRLEFTLSAEMREKCGYGKELLWAEITNFDGDAITARIAETSELLPECHEGDEILVSEENITGWLIRAEGDDTPFTEEDSYYFMGEA